MRVTLDNKKGLKKDLKVFIDKKTVEGYIMEKYEELKKNLNLKGFRPGKVPIEVIKRQFGKAVYSEVLDKILRETSSNALEEKKIKVAGQPKIDLKTFGEDKDLEYVIHVEQLPEIKVKGIENIKLTDYQIKVSSNNIEKKIKEIAKNQNNFKDRKDGDLSEKNDLITFDYKATVDSKDFEGGKGKNTQIILGKDLFIKGFDNQLIGVKKNQEKVVEVILPENFPNKEYINKKAKFLCRILNIKKPEQIIINEEFAKNLGAKDLNDLKSIVSKQIENQYKNTLDSITKKEILNELDKFKDITIPESLVEQEIKTLTQGIKKEEIGKNKKDLEKQARKRIKIGLILNEFGEQNNLKISDDEIKNEIQKQIKMMPGQEKMVSEYYQKNQSAISSLKGSLYEEKIISLIKEKAKLTKKTISTDEAEKIIIKNTGDKEKTKKITMKSAKKSTKVQKEKKRIKKVSKK